MKTNSSKQERLEAKLERKRLREELKKQKLDMANNRKINKALRKKKLALAKQFKKTVDWIDVDYVADNFISIHNQEYILFGMKVIPPEIVLESNRVIMSWLNRLVLVQNSTMLPLINDTILSPINVDVEIMHLQEKMNNSDDPVMKRSFLNEIELLEETSMNMRSEYFILCFCKTTDKKTIQKFDELFRRFSSESFNVEALNKRDLMNYIAFKFNNQYIYDFYFSKGLFEDLEQYNTHLDFESGEASDE